MNKQKEPVEPYNLREWTTRHGPQESGRLFTCGRPGRGTFGIDKVQVPRNVIDLWARGLPKTDLLHIVSLLGQKRDGLSEFWYYPFGSSTESDHKPTFEKWLNSRYAKRFVVHEFPTTDHQGVPPEVRDEVAHCVSELMKKGYIVVIVDSARAERTGRIRERLGYTQVVLTYGTDEQA